MRRAVLTGFEPFGPYSFNPTMDLAKEYDGKIVGGIEVTGVVVPCTYFGAFETLSAAMDKLAPDIVLSTGLASRVPRIRFETAGRNIMNGKYPDAEGKKPAGEPIVEGGRELFMTNADNAALVRALSESGIDAELSVDAEGFICNSLIYLTARKIETEGLPTAYAFFHTPWTDDYAGRVQLDAGRVMIVRKSLSDAAGITMIRMRVI